MPSPVKHAVLRAIDDLDSPTYREIADVVDRPPKRVGWYLTRYRRKGLIKPTLYASGPGKWSLTQRGRDRLDYFNREKR